jgi:hypothetical protein
MKRLTLTVALAAALAIGVPIAHADSFTYHGSLQDAGQPADGNYDMQLTLYSQREGGAVLAGPVTLYGVKVTKGNFVTNVDFAQTAPLSSQAWVDVKVKPASAGSFVALDARSPVTPDGTCPGSWALDGNAANPSGSYIGTADNQPLVFKTNGISAGEFLDNSPDNPTFQVYGATSLAFSDGASGQNSLAAGYHGVTHFEGSFNWSPRFGTIASVPDTANEQFIVNAPHGVGINTATAPDGTPLRDELTVAPSPDLPSGNADITLETSTQASGYNGFNINAIPDGYFQINGLYDVAGALAYDSLLYINYHHLTTNYYANWQLNGAPANGIFAIGYDGSSGNGAYLTAGGVWTNASSRAFKEGFAKVDVATVLDKLVSIPVQTWFYKQAHNEGLHMGPVAEDFAETFGLGKDNQHIGTVDESGVAFAAIQGLNQKVESENARLRDQNADLHSQLDRVMARLDKLEANGEK